MTNHLERELETLFYDGVRRAGGLAYKLVPSHVGLPDRFALWPGGRVTFVELKRTGEKPRASQLEIHRKWELLGVHVTVLAGASEIKTWLSGQALL